MHPAPDQPGAARPEVRDAATVMLVRDGDDGLEVFMQRRNLRAAFVAGAYVFPGGALDEFDRDPDLEAWCDGLDALDANSRMGVASHGLSYWVAAIRECFEEAGVLLAYDASGTLISFAEAATAARFEQYRTQVTNGTLALIELCRREELRLATRAMHYFSHWITPIGPPRRFDTRFFVCGTPASQVGSHDDGEAIASTWIRPQGALDACARGELEMILPTIKNLESLARFTTAAELLDAAAQIGDVPTILPKLAPPGESPHSNGQASLPARR